MRWLVLVAIAGLAHSQERPAFEAASIKVNSSTDEMSMRGARGTLEWTSTSLRYFVQVAPPAEA